MDSALEVQRRPAMKKNSIGRQSPQRAKKGSQEPITIGMDLGDKSSCYCVLNGQGEVIQEAKVSTTRKGLTQAFSAMGRCRMAIEVGTHSPWVSRWLSQLGHEVIVANARQVKLISASSRKDDRLDAQTLARLARVDPQLLRPIRHRSEAAQMHWMTIRVREALVEARTALINAARGMAKAVGERMAACGSSQVSVERMEELSEPVRETLRPLLEQTESLTAQVQECDHKIEQIAREHYPETELLQQVSGVGTLIALTFVLTLENRERFPQSRDVGCYVGLRPQRSESGASQPELRITKEGDPYLRQLLVQGAHHIVGWRGPDTDLRRWGWKLAARGGRNAKKRAIVAVARKLGILLHHLWVTGEGYEPLRHSHSRQRMQAA
jgi:transposase